jgi:membrane-associated phospholipid phosphatase
LEKQSILPQVKNNFYVLAVLAYTLFLIYNYMRAGVLFQYDLGVLALIILPVVLYVLQKTRKSEQQLFLRQWIPFIVILLSYEALQGTAGAIVSGGNIINLYPLDRMLWDFNLTGTIQREFFSTWLTDLTLIFYTMHFYLVILASVVFWLFRRSLFTKYAIAITITSYVSLLIFAIAPTAPPWFTGVACNLASSSSSCYLAGISWSAQVAPPVLSQMAHFNNIIESDKFAAFPSLHAAYVTLFAAYMIKFKKKLVFAMIPLEFAVLFATLYLGQHYLIDLIAGVSLALTSVFLADVVVRKFNPFGANENTTNIQDQYVEKEFNASR